MKALLRRVLPAWALGPLRGIYRGVTASRYSPLRPVLEHLRHRRLLGRLRRSLAGLDAVTAPEQLTLEMMERIANAWSNRSYSGDPGFLLQMARLAFTSTGPVLDCGSGISTVVAARLVARRGETVVSLEQDQEWHRHLARVLADLRVENVQLWYTPLRPFDDFVWYDLGDRRLPARFGLISCDGPAVYSAAWPAALYQSWRVGVVPVLLELKVDFDWILLDDETDPRARGVIARWGALGVPLEVVETPTGRHLIGRRHPVP